MSKVLFLDFDGVLNNMLFWLHDKSQKGNHRIDPRAVQVLNHFLRFHNDAKVVASTAWRVSYPIDYLNTALRTQGYEGPDITDVTPRNNACYDSVNKRASEIFQYIRDNNVQYPLAIDDMPLNTPFSIQTDSDIGLTYGDLVRANTIPGWGGYVRPIVLFY